jgi:NAD(P)H-dependent FMN reductase
LAAGREVSDSPSPAVETAEQFANHSHVACALMNGLSSRTTATPDTHGVVMASTDDSKPAVALSERIAAFDSVLFVAPKTSPPSVTV